VLLVDIFPKLTELVTPKRSVLAQRAIIAAYSAVATASEAAGLTNDESLHRQLWELIPSVDKLLQLNQSWIKSSISSCKGAQISRKKLALSVLTDWRCIHEEMERHYVNDEQTVLSGRLQASYFLIHHWNGELIDGVAIGSLRHTLCSETKLRSQAIMSYLSHAVTLSQSVREVKELNRESKLVGRRLRSTIRGIASWLAESRKHSLNVIDHKTSNDNVCLETVVGSLTTLLKARLKARDDRTVELVLAIL
jgi:hypothetical protein